MEEQEHAQTDDVVTLRLTDEEYCLLTEHVRLLPGVDEALEDSAEEGDWVSVRLTLERLYELTGAIAFAANHADTRELEDDLSRLWEHLVLQLARSEKAAEILASADDFELSVIQWTQAAATEETQPASRPDFLVECVKQAAVTPVEEFGGLSPVQVGALIASDWDDPEGVVRVNEGLPLSDLQSAPMLVNARVFLQAALDADGIKTTQAGNLNRRFVDNMLDAMEWEPGFAEAVRNVRKAPNEQHVRPLHILRLLLQGARLLRKAKGTFSVTNRGRRLLAESEAGKLYAALFKTMFRKLNLAYVDWLPDDPEMQITVAFSLFMIDRHADEWIDKDELARKVLLPESSADARISLLRQFRLWAVRSRLLEPLWLFGLLELRQVESETAVPDSIEVRKTGLYEKFLQFHLQDAQPPSHA